VDSAVRLVCEREGYRLPRNRRFDLDSRNQAFWQQTLDRLRASGKTILVGARLPIGRYQPVQQDPYDFSAELAALHGRRSSPFPRRRFQQPNAAFAYDNAVVVRGAETATAVQRIPVSIGMWNPFQSQGARANLFARTVTPIAGERAAVLVCYEQILIWPVLSSALEHPTVFVAVANDHWAIGTPIPAFQTTAIRAWSRLFGIPFLTATNQ
jgi:hypothetical protein